MHLEHRAQELQEHLQFVETQVGELSGFSEQLTTIGKGADLKILANVGKGVHIPAHVTGQRVFVDIGAGYTLPKNLSEVQHIIEGQVRQLQESRQLLTKEMQLTTTELGKMLMQLQHPQA